MKKLIFSWLLSVLFLSTAFAQYGTVRTGYEGDYFSLEGALDLFKQSYNLRDFERALNTEENWVNNLDLNYDGRIDYIRVEHRRQGNFHAIILQALVGRYDVQDVAVIEIEVIGRGEAILQIVGDEDLYGEEVIVEPVEGYADSRRGYHSDYGGYVNVYYWDPVQYILGRQYQVYVSPYRWHYYPVWWSPWTPCTWSIFRPRIVVYHQYYHVVHHHRVVRVHNFYRPYRSYSYTVVQHTNKVRVSQGRPAIHRPAPAASRDRSPSGYRSRNEVVEQPRTTNRSGAPAQRPYVSRKSDQESTRGTTPRTDQPSRRSVDRPDVSRSTPTERPASGSRTATPSAEQKSNRSTTSRVDQRSRSSANSSGVSRSSTPAQRPATNSRNTTPSSDQKASRSTTPQARQQTSGTTSRSQAAPRSTTPDRKPAASSRSTTPPVRQKATESTVPERNSSKHGSKSRGGGDLKKQ